MHFSDLCIQYDRFVDVLCINIKNTKTISTREKAHKVLWQYGALNALVGFTIFDYKELNQKDIIEILEEFLEDLKIPKEAVLCQIRELI